MSCHLSPIYHTPILVLPSKNMSLASDEFALGLLAPISDTGDSKGEDDVIGNRYVS